MIMQNLDESLSAPLGRDLCTTRNIIRNFCRTHLTNSTVNRWITMSYSITTIVMIRWRYITAGVVRIFRRHGYSTRLLPPSPATDPPVIDSPPRRIYRGPSSYTSLKGSIGSVNERNFNPSQGLVFRYSLKQHRHYAFATVNPYLFGAWSTQPGARKWRFPAFWLFSARR